MQNIKFYFCMVLFLKINAISIKFFADQNLRDFILESNSTSACNNVLRDKTRLASAFVETDTCLMIYRHPNCQSPDSQKILPGITSENGLWIESFHICNKNEGGSTLNVDITQYYDYNTPAVVPDVLQSFQRVCSCVNIPHNILQTEQWSINNHGNEVFAFYEPDCKQTRSTATLIKAGNNGISRRSKFLKRLEALIKLNKSKILSLGPNPDSLYFRTSCNSNLELIDDSLNSFDDHIGQDRQVQTNSDPQQITAPLEFYAHVNFAGFLFETEVNADCNNLPQPSDPRWVNNKIGSVKSNKCLVFYSAYECTGRSTKFGSPGISDLVIFWGLQPKSFHLCNSSFGGVQLNVDITEHGQYLSKANPPLVLQSYQDICNCKKIPQFIQNKRKWSVNNYANSLIAYFEQDCLSTKIQPLWIPAGYGIVSEDVGLFGRSEKYTGIIQRVQSLGPDPNAQYFKNNCINLESTIIKFEITEPHEDMNSEQNMEITASKTVFQNNGPAQLSQTYSASKSVQESFKIEIGSSLSNMKRVQVDATFDVETKKGTGSSESNTRETSQGWEKTDSKALNTTTRWHGGGGGSASVSILGILKIGGGGGGSKTTTNSESNQHSNTRSGSSRQGNERSNSIFQEAGFKQGLRSAYESSETRSKSYDLAATVENSRTFTVSQVINVPACTEHVVNAYVKVVTNKRVEYRALAKISGKIGGKVMLSAEVRNFMDSDLEYVSDFDDHTVLAYSKGTFRAEYGISSYISSEGSRLHDCMARITSRQTNCPKCECSHFAATTSSSIYAHPFMAYAGMI